MELTAEILKKTYETKFRNSTGTSSNGEPPPPTQPEGGKPDCEVCGGLGFIVPDVAPTHPSFGRAVPCTCRAEQMEVERQEQLSRMSQLGALTACTFDSFIPEGVSPNQSHQTSLRTAFQLTQNFAQNPNGWLILKGGYGCGKTHLAAAIANYRLENGKPVLFVNTPDLLDHLRAAYSPSSVTTYDERFEQVRNTPLLILDDFGSQSNTEWAQEKMYQIFNHRYNARLPTVITTNMDLDAIERRVRSRLADTSLAQTVHILAPDFRSGGVDQSQSELSVLELHYDKQFSNFDVRDRELPPRESSNLRRALEMARDFADDPEGWIVFMSVGYGNGKTHLAAAIANQIQQRGERVLFIVVPDLLDHLRSTFSPNSIVRYDKRFEQIKTIPYLVLDDLGTESATAWAREKLFQLFNYRYIAKLPTIITSANHVEDLPPQLASKVLDDRLCSTFVIEAPSYRGGLRSKGKRRS